MLRIRDLHSLTISVDLHLDPILHLCVKYLLGF